MPNTELDILQKRMFTTKEVLTILALVASATFTLTTIYNRFLLIESIQTEQNENFHSEMDQFKEYYEERIEILDDRISKTTKRNSDRIDKLEEKGSDAAE